MRNWIFLSVLVTACTVQKRVCPAYQSAFLFDKNTRENHFNHYNNSFKNALSLTASSGKTIELPKKDSLWILTSVGLDGPALPFHKKLQRDKYLFLPKKSKKKRLKSLNTVERKFVYEAYDSAAMKEIHRLDSISLLDSVYRISEAREKFNLDQDAYMWYFKDYLILPDVRWEKFDKPLEEKKIAEASKKAEKKAKWKKLFKWFSRKKKKASDSIASPSDSLAVGADKKSLDEENYNADEVYDIETELGSDSTVVKNKEPEKKRKRKNTKPFKGKKQTPVKKKPIKKKEEDPAMNDGALKKEMEKNLE